MMMVSYWRTIMRPHALYPSDRMEFKSAGSCLRGRHTLFAEPRAKYLSEPRQGLWSFECQGLELSFRRSEFDWADFALLPHGQR
jgi:hypothetical protein